MPPSNSENFTNTSFVAPPPRQKIGKFAGSKRIIIESWGILKQDKEILWLPLLSFLASLGALVVFGLIFFFVSLGGDSRVLDEGYELNLQGLDWILFLAYYTTMYFIVNFFQASIFVIAHARMQGQDLTLRDGLKGAQLVAGNILAWSLISATVGLILQIISERSKIVGRIVASFLGAGWNLLTFFSLPALVISKVSVADSFKSSTNTIRKTWGETIIINLGVGFVFGIVIALGFILGLIVITLAPYPLVILTVVVLYILFVIALAILSSALSAIFKLALYEYAQTGVVPQGFSADLMQATISAGKKK